MRTSHQVIFLKQLNDKTRIDIKFFSGGNYHLPFEYDFADLINCSFFRLSEHLLALTLSLVVDTYLLKHTQRRDHALSSIWTSSVWY